MQSLGGFLIKVKPVMDSFIRDPNKQTLEKLQGELRDRDFMDLKIIHTQLLAPLVLKLEQLEGVNQDLRTGTIECITTVIGTLYLKDVRVVHTILFIVLQQIRDCAKAINKPDASEELKLAVVSCFTTVLQRSTSDILEQFYAKESNVLLGQILLALIQFIEQEKYRILIGRSMECLMTVFYVHDNADHKDVVLRNQVADTLFIYLPKIIRVLINKSLDDDKIGGQLKAKSIKSLGRILCIIFDDTNETVINISYDVKDFRHLIAISLSDEHEEVVDIYDKKTSQKDGNLEDRLKRLQGDGRSEQWFKATARKLRPLLNKTSILRAHTSTHIREAYATLCCTILLQCSQHVQNNVVVLLESIISLSEDEEENIRNKCIDCLQQLQNVTTNSIFDEDCELLLDDHLRSLPRIIKRVEEHEQYSAFCFLKGFINNINKNRLKVIFALPKRLELFCNCLTAAVELQTTHELLTEEYSLRSLHEDIDAKISDCNKLKWRKYENVHSTRLITLIQQLCEDLGKTSVVNMLIFEHFLEQLQEERASMNEILLIMQFIAKSNTQLTHKLLDIVLQPQHWHLQLVPDKQLQLDVKKPSKWFSDYTPGLYESGIEIRVQDYDSDDELEAQTREQHVGIRDVQYNVLYTCIVLDTLGHCAQHLATAFDTYIFKSLHHVLLRIGHRYIYVHQAAFFAFIQIQKALHFHKASQFVESHLDYIGYHLNMLLKREPESSDAIEILTVTLQFTVRKSLTHFENVFQTILESCSKSEETNNICAYLKVFTAFLRQVSAWEEKLKCSIHIETQLHSLKMETDVTINNQLLDIWKSAISVTDTTVDDDLTEPAVNNEGNKQSEESIQIDNESVPRHISLVERLLKQAVKFLSDSKKMTQILAMECISAGIPILKDYEDILLPLVHMTWKPLVDKFHQRDAVVLQRCFELLTVLSCHAKDFLLERSLKDVIPYLKQFLQEAALHSAAEHTLAKTQEYKLQFRLLSDFAKLIISLDIEKRMFYDICEVCTLYLSEKQPCELQKLAIMFFTTLQQHNCALIYSVLVQRANLPLYKTNTGKLIHVILSKS